MSIINKKNIFLFGLTALISQTLVFGQLLKHDDFQFKDNYWYWRSDGNQAQPTVENGLLKLKLENAVDNYYCNTEIYDPTEPYLPGTQIKIRLKTSNIHHGSRGWGFWDGDLDSSILYDYDVAWVMQQSSEKSNAEYNWFLFGSNGDSLKHSQIYNLQNRIDETDWHTYNIVWRNNSVSFFIDDILKYETFKFIPNEGMRFDVWIDNRVINLFDPTDFFNNNVKSSEIFVDYVEISGLDGPNIERTFSEPIILWDSPNSFPNNDEEKLWKSYNINTKAQGEILIFISGLAENYADLSNADKLKITFDGNDLGWDSEFSFNGNKLNGKGSSIIYSSNISSGNHNLKIYSDITPFLRDVIVLHSENRSLIFKKNYNETASGNDGLWKSISLNSENNEKITILISGTAFENDGINIKLNEKDFGLEGDKSFNGNELNGTPNTIALSENLSEGSNKLEIYKKGNPQLYSIAIYGNNTITDVNNEIKDSYKNLVQVNPNPFNNSTNIKYSTNSDSFNKISIYNLLGENVEILLSKFQKKGEYNLTWNANNQPSGIYFCVFESQNFHNVQKIILLK